MWMRRVRLVREPSRMVWPPFEELFAEQVLQADHVPAEGALRHMQRVGAGGEAQVLTHGVEGAQGVQRQPTAVDQQDALTSLKIGLRR